MKFFYYIKRKILFWYFHVECGKDLRVRGDISLGWKVNLKLGDSVTINSGIKGNPNPIGNEVTTSFCTVYDGKIVIGNNVGISNSTIYSRESVIIEDDVMIGGGCKIFDTDFHPISYKDRINNIEDKVKSASVRICKGAFIGADCIVMKGVTIGEKSVIGAGSIVTRSVPPNEVWAGNPARFINKVGG